jgi:glutamine amidotransferase
MIVIVDYNVGNVRSVKNMFSKIGIEEVLISNKQDDIRNADKIILPGVGAFDTGMNHLKSYGLIDVLNEKVLVDKIPILGICLGMQLLTKSSEEGKEKGLGWIDAKTIKFDLKIKGKYKVPHMGWSDVKFIADHSIWNNNDFDGESRFYFVHSYHIETSEEYKLVQCDYGYEFTAGIKKDNIIGVQFHPEKSHKFGMQLLSNFVNKF